MVNEWNKTYPRKEVPAGPKLTTREASASPSQSGGGTGSFSFLTSRHVILVGPVAIPGGMTILTPA